MKKKQILSVLLACLMVVAFAAGCGSKKDQPERVFLNIAAGGTGGAYFPLAGAVAEILNRNIPGMNASAQTTGASVANINLLNEGKVDFVFAQTDITYYAANGLEMFQDRKMEHLRGLAVLYPETVQIITLERSGIRTIEDIRGKRVAVGAAGSGTEANARQILAAHGITYDDVSVQYLSFNEAANGIRDGNVDVGFVTAGFPTAAVQDIGSQHTVVLVPIAPNRIEALMREHPFYIRNDIPADAYGLGADVTAVAVNAMLVTTTKMSDEMANNIVKLIYGNLDRIEAAHTIGRHIKKETALTGMPITASEGAEKFFKE